MARARAICVCETCGRKFEKIKFVNSRKDAESWESWAVENITECYDCWRTRIAEERARDNAAAGRSFPTLHGSPKMIAWANNIRQAKIDEAYAEMDNLRAFLPRNDAKDDPLCVPMLLALMSMRIAEIDALRWENIQPDADFIQTTGTRIMDEHNQWVEQEEHKTEDSDRQVPLIIPELRAAIKRDWKPEGKLLEVHQMTLRRAVDRTCAKAGVKRVTVHQLRHSSASLSAHLGIPKEISMETRGWSNDKIMNEIYTHIAHSDIERYRNRMWSFYNANAEAPSNALQCTSQ